MKPLWQAITSGALLLAFCLNCAPSMPAAHVDAVNAARRAYAKGDYSRAAEHWRVAAETAPNAHHENEALYRQAVSLQRAGDVAAAEQLLRRVAVSASARSARASFDSAYLDIERGEAERGYAALRRALLSHPQSGLADKALKRLLDHATESSGPAADLRLLDDLEPHVGHAELHELLLYERARRIESLRGGRHALAHYRRVVVEHPYPEGRFWDESVLHSVRLLRELGHPRRALAWIVWMLEHREAANWVGSYERHYSQAHFEMAEIWRDDLGDWRRARAEFRAVFEQYPTSLLRDDALWEAVQLSLAHAEPAAACDDLEVLRSQLPNSRHLERTQPSCPP